MPDGKYIVFKAEAWDKFLTDFADKLTPTVGEALNNLCSGEVPDAVVIRRQDVFAPPALDAYANAITVAISLDPHAPRFRNLREVADYFHQQAELAWHTDRKIPD